MHKTLTAFVGATHVDETDKLAQRALKAFITLSGLMGNAYNRGDAEAYTEVSRAHLEASIAFALINEEKAYPFAAEVLATMPPVIISEPQPPAFAAFLVGSAESAIATYADRCTPVCTMSGIDSVHILRGEHAAYAMRDVVPANTNVA